MSDIIAPPPCPSTISDEAFDAIIHARHSQPHAVLGMHLAMRDGVSGLVVRALIQDAKSCDVVNVNDVDRPRYLMARIEETDLFEVFIPEQKVFFAYRLRARRHNGEIHQFYDPYSFLPTLTDEDLYLFNQGNHHQIYKKLGSHPRVINDVPGVAFAVWAPNAKRVSIVGNFNQWDGRFHVMRSMGSSGVWELFIPGLDSGVSYKYEILDGGDGLRLKSDPYAVYFESPPHNASIIYELDQYTWADERWLTKRSQQVWREQPISVYEVHLGSWKRVVEDGCRPLTYREIAHDLASYVKKMGFTHVELLPVAEHPFSGSWGYQVTGFFAPTHRFGSPNDFKYFIDVLHQHDIGVIVDWVPAHFPRDAFALAEFDGTCLYEHADPRQGQHRDWGTLIFNFARLEVRNFLLCSALSWFERFHIDGLRVDAVASMLYLDYSREEGEWIPNEYGGKENLAALDFIRSTNDLVHQYYPGALMIAEESTSWSGVTRPSGDDGGLGFDFKWNMGWMHDNLTYFSKDPIHRQWHHNQLTFGMLYQYTEHFILAFSHDEVVHGKGSMLGKMPFSDIPTKAQALRGLYAWMWAWPGKKTLFMGGEFGQSNEWYYDQSLDWHLLEYKDHSGIQSLVVDLNHWYLEHYELGYFDGVPEGFQWLDCNDAANSVLSFLRRGTKPEQTHVVVGNFTPVARKNYRVGVPYLGFWQECVNTNAKTYGGTGEGNLGGLYAEEVPWMGQPYSINLQLFPLSTSFFQLDVTKSE